MLNAQHIILTPSQTLARALQHAHAKQQLSQGQAAWEKPVILTMHTWLKMLHEHLALTQPAAHLPIGGHQAKRLWAQVIDEDILMGRAGLAKMARNAWQRIHEHQLPTPQQWPDGLLNEDQRAFKRWAKRYVSHCKQHQMLDLASFLPALAKFAQDDALPKPNTLTLHGFALPPAPAHQRIVDALAAHGTVVNNEGPPKKAMSTSMAIHACPTADDELTRACLWAKQHLEDSPNHRVGLIIPDLDQRLALAEKTLQATFDPQGTGLLSDQPPVWHLGASKPLANLPLVSEALAILTIQPNKMTQPQAIRLLHNPWIQGWPEEMAKRQRLVFVLQQTEPYWLNTNTLIKHATKADCPALANGLKKWAKQCAQSPKITHTDGWAEQFQQELSALGFGFGRPLNNAEHQAMDQWHRALEVFSDLSALQLNSTHNHTRTGAQSELLDVARDMRWAEPDLGAPVSVMPVEEALGLQFDALWITGLDEDSWPSSPQRTALIPNAMQLDILSSTPKGCVALAKQHLTTLCASASVICGSHPIGDEEWTLRPTRLLHELIDCRPIHHDTVMQLIERAPVRCECIENDTAAPPLPPKPTTDGGVRLLNDQSTCPFKAFATHRLQAKDHRMPRPGISAKDRGILVHNVLEAFWETTKNSIALAGIDDDQLLSLVGEHVDHELNQYIARHPNALDAMTRALERQNLVGKITAWLQLERQRPEFEVTFREEDIHLEIGPLKLTGRPDRIDRLADGQWLIIDYKTGKAEKKAWASADRLADGQLPAYALNVHPQAKAIAFARIAKDHIGFDGLAETDLEIDGITVPARIKQGKFKDFNEWSELTAHWHHQLESLAHEFQQGHAAVAPVDANACRHCHLKAMCRIEQRRVWFDELTSQEGALDD